MSATDLPEDITYWLVSGSNGTGGKTWASGVKIDARTARISHSKTDKEGRTEVFNTAVYAKTSIPIGAYIYIGDDLGANTPHTDARRVVDVISNPTMSDLSKMVM